MKDVYWIWIATLGPIGRLPWAPGTWASLLACGMGFFLSFSNPPIQMGVILCVCIVGTIVSERHVQITRKEDSREVVVDEVAGQLITLVFLPFSVSNWVLGFLMFRILDIWKPFPISWLDRRIKGGVGIMADDIAAGLIASLLLQILARTLPL
ncbi:MAG: phosphatidylglycerophosphatase A [Bdellovibrio sp.]